MTTSTLVDRVLPSEAVAPTLSVCPTFPCSGIADEGPGEERRVDPFPLCAEALLLYPMHLLQPLLSHYPSAPWIEPVVWPCVARSGR